MSDFSRMVAEGAADLFPLWLLLIPASIGFLFGLFAGWMVWG